MLKYIGIIIGILVLIVSLYYLFKDKEDKESKKIYTISSVFGLVIILISFLF